MGQKHIQDDPRTRSNSPTDDSVEARIGKRVKLMPNGCWAYNGDLTQYGQAYISGEITQAHRFVYATLVGDIEPGNHVHHECQNPGCVNPDHLVQLTPAEHAQRHVELRNVAA